MKELQLSAEKREGLGKGPAGRVRVEGKIPAVIYGPEIKPISISVEQRQFKAAMKSIAGANAFFNLDVGGKKSKVIVRDMQLDPVTSTIIHVDFHAISMTKPLHLSIPIHLEGIPRGVKTDGGIMQTNMRTLEVSCLPSQIPEFVTLDVTDLGIGDSIHVRNITLEDVQILAEPQRTVVVISAPTVVKEDTPAEEEVEEGAEVAVEGEEGATAETKEEGKTEDKKEEKKADKKGDKK